MLVCSLFYSMCRYKTLHLHLFLRFGPIQSFSKKQREWLSLCEIINPVFLLLTTFQQCAVKLLRATARRAEKRPAIGCSGRPAPPEGRRLKVPAAVAHLHRSTPPKTKGQRSPGHFVNILYLFLFSITYLCVCSH